MNSNIEVQAVFKCRVCSAVFEDKNKARVHKCTTLPFYICPYCPKDTSEVTEYSTVRRVQKHVSEQVSLSLL